MAHYRCPVCGHKNLERPAYNGGPEVGAASEQICGCCYFHYGYDDDAAGHTFADWRNQWIAEGMPWRSTQKKPRNYSPTEQLKHVDMNVVRKRWWEIDGAE